VEDLEPPTLKQYAVWTDEEGAGYWSLYDDKESAACEAGGRDVYLMRAKKLGVFVVKTVVQKKHQRRKRKV
jgi:hypothetical protein